MTGNAGRRSAVERTHRWRGLAGAALVAGAVSLFAREQALLSACAAAVALVGYARVAGPRPASVALVRSVDSTDPDPGDRVEVTVRVENTGDSTVSQVVVADGVPETLSVVEGSPVLGTALRPGATASLTYTVVVPHGSHEFASATVTARDVVGVAERERRVDAAGVEELATQSAETPVAVTPDAAVRPGRQQTDLAGDGVAFRTVREYRRGDPLSRVDWARRARTGDLATVEFHADRQAPVVLAVDSRRAAAVAPDAESRTARERAFEAANALYGTLTGDGQRVGVATFGAGATWLPPGRTAAHERRARDALTVPDGDDEERSWGAWLAERLPPRAVVVVFTPACDDGGVGVAKYLRAVGYSVSVVSPDPTAADTPGRWLARVERERRLRSLRADRVSVVDWPAGASFREAAVGAGWAE
ncbi:MAG: DUF58 domain-containing protein [Halobacterium sp.]